MSQLQGSYGKVYVRYGRATKYVNKYRIKKGTNNTTTKFESTSVKEMNALSSLPLMGGLLHSIGIFGAGDNFGIVTKYSGRTLKKWVTKNSEVDDRIKKLPNILFQLLNILKVLEDLKVVHGDMKPDNILINDEGVITLIDFGGFIFDTTIIPVSRNREGFNMCTYWFSSPEMLSLKYKNNNISHKHDIFSLGLIMKFLLLGKYTKDEDLFITVAEKNGNERYDIDVNILAGVPDQLSKLITDMLIINADNRPSASTLLESDIFENMVPSLISTYSPFDYGILQNCNYKISRGKVVEWMYKVCEKCKVLYLLVLAVRIFDRSTYYSYHLVNDDLIAYGMASLIISDSILQLSYFTMEYMMLSCTDMKKDIKEVVCLILNKLNYKVYERTFDYYLRSSSENIDYNIVKEMLMNTDISELSHQLQVNKYYELKQKEELKKESIPMVIFHE